MTEWIWLILTTFFWIFIILTVFSVFRIVWEFFMEWLNRKEPDGQEDDSSDRPQS